MQHSDAICNCTVYITFLSSGIPVSYTEEKCFSKDCDLDDMDITKNSDLRKKHPRIWCLLWFLLLSIGNKALLSVPLGKFF